MKRYLLIVGCAVLAGFAGVWIAIGSRAPSGRLVESNGVRSIPPATPAPAVRAPAAVDRAARLPSSPAQLAVSDHE
jgi:hypothetical protein